jgi:hypothetical protein
MDRPCVGIPQDGRERLPGWSGATLIAVAAAGDGSGFEARDPVVCSWSAGRGPLLFRLVQLMAIPVLSESAPEAP